MTAGIAFLLLAVAIFRLRSSHRNHPVLIAMAVASSLYGIAQLHYFSLEIARYFAGRTFLYDGYLGITDMFLQMAVGLGMVGALLEDERLNIEEKSAALQRSEEQLRSSQKMEVVGQLAGGIAHDFNNLLAVILGYSELAYEESDPDSNARANLDEVRKAAGRAAALTRQLLTFSRNEAQQAIVVDLNRVVTDMDPMLRHFLTSSVRLKTNTQDSPVAVMADPSQLEQIVLNLALNGRDAMPGGGELSISVSTELGAVDCARLTVRDTGIGMAAAVMEKIFEPFFTTKERNKGTGLGLSTIYGIVSSYDGRIEVESKEGAGSQFSVFLPLIAGVLDEVLPRPAVSKAMQVQRTVLIVDDRQQVLELAARILVEAGFLVLQANGGLQARARMKEHAGKIDILLCDVVMPTVSGLEIAAYARKQFPGLHIIFMSGFTDREDVRKIRSDLHAGFIHKPFTPGELVTKVSQHINESTPAVLPNEAQPIQCAQELESPSETSTPVAGPVLEHES